MNGGKSKCRRRLTQHPYTVSHSAPANIATSAERIRLKWIRIVRRLQRTAAFGVSGSQQELDRLRIPAIQHDDRVDDQPDPCGQCFAKDNADEEGPCSLK